MGTYKESVIKKLDGYIKPVVSRNDKGTVLNVGMSDGQKYYNYNKLESGLIPKPRTFDESMHKSWGGFQYYLNDMSVMIENGQVYIKYESPPIIEKPPEPNRQTSLF